MATNRTGLDPRKTVKGGRTSSSSKIEDEIIDGQTVQTREVAGETLYRQPSGGFSKNRPSFESTPVADTPAPTSNAKYDPNKPLSATNQPGQSEGLEVPREITDQELVNRGMFSENDLRAKKFGEEQGLDTTFVPETFSDLVKLSRDQNKKDQERLQADIWRQQQAGQIAMDRAKTNAEASEAGASAAFAQGREGPMSQSAPFAFGTFQETLQENIKQKNIQFEQNQANRMRAMEDLKMAQKKGDAKLIEAASAALGRAEQQAKQAETDLLNAQSLANKTAIEVTASAAENIAAMGSAAADLSNEDLSAMIQGSNLNMGQAMALRSAAVLEGQAALAQDAATTQQILANVEKIRGDVKAQQAGRTAAERDFNILQEKVKSGKYTQQDINDYKILSGINPQNMTPFEWAKFREIQQDIDATRFENGIYNNDTNVVNTILNASSAQGYHDHHEALDYTLAGGKSAPVQTPVSGTARIFSQDNGQGTGYGNSVMVTDAEGRQHLFAHLSQFDTSRFMDAEGNFDPNAVVTMQAGDMLGLQGNTGQVTAVGAGGDGTHVHYEVRNPDGTKVNPKEFLNGLPKAETSSDADSIQARFNRANAGVSTQVRESNNQAYRSALATGDQSIIEETVLEIERDKFLPRTEKITNDFTKKTQGYEEIVDQNNRLQAVWDAFESGEFKEKGAVDQALITIFNKMLDPGSVVRESEFNRTPEGFSAVSRLEGALAKINKGGVGITNKNRQDLFDATVLLVEGAQKTFDQQLDKAKTKAGVAGVPEQFLLESLGIESNIPEEDDSASTYTFNQESPILDEIDKLSTAKGVDIDFDKIQAAIDKGFTLEQIRDRLNK